MLITERAYAKVNLHLAVGARRPDGFHDVLSLMQCIDFYDTLHMDIEDANRWECRIQGMDIPPRENILFKTVQCWFEATGQAARVDVQIEKNIPFASGLGGGSSDASVLLLALNGASPHPVSKQQLMQIGASIGSDVPFFLSQTSAALVSGRGEQVLPLVPRSDLEIILVFPHNERQATGRAFEMLDELNVVSQLDRSETIIAQYQLPCVSWEYTNDFSVLFHDREPYRQLFELAQTQRDIHAQITGSGACFYALSDNGAVLEEFNAKIPKILSHQGTVLNTKMLALPLVQC